MASAILLYISCFCAVIIYAQQGTLLYYDNMEDAQATGWMHEYSSLITQETGVGYCTGGCVKISSYLCPTCTLSQAMNSEIERTFDIYGYTDLVVSVDIARGSMSGSYEVYLEYICDAAWGKTYSTPIYMGEYSPSSYTNRNFTISDYSTVTCSNAKTMNLRFAIYSLSSYGYLDEVRIYYGSTYSQTPAPTYSSNIFLYDDMKDFSNTGWFAPCVSCQRAATTFVGQGYDFCGADGAYCLQLNNAGAYISRYNIDTTGSTFVAVQYIVGSEFNVVFNDRGSKYIQLQYKCGISGVFQPVVTHFAVTTATQHTVILPCTSSNTAIRLYAWNEGNDVVNFDEICMLSWSEGTNAWSTDYCPNSVARVDYSSSVYWFDNFDNDLNQWFVEALNLMIAALYIDTDTNSNTAGTIGRGKFVVMNGNNVSLISRTMNGYGVSTPDIQFDFQSVTGCGRGSNDKFMIEYVCSLSNYQWIVLKTYTGDFEGQNVIVSSPCSSASLHQIRFKSVSEQSTDQVFIDNVYFCKSGQCPGDSMVNPSAGIIFYDQNVTNRATTTWIYVVDYFKSTNIDYYRRRFNGLSNCDDLYIQYDITKSSFDGSGTCDSVKIEYLYDSSATSSYGCSGDATWTELVIYTGTDFIDQKILQLPCSAQFYGSLSIKFTVTGTCGDAKDVKIENFYLCNGRASCPAPFPTVAPTKNPSNHPSIPPTRAPTKNPTITPIKMASSNPSKIPSKTPSRNPTISVSRADGRIVKEGLNCFSGYKDLAQSDPNYDTLCEECPDGTAGTYGKCEECGLFQVPNDRRDSCEYYQPWWLWLAETLLGLGILGCVIWCIKKGKKVKTNDPDSNKQHLELANQTPPYESGTVGYTR